MNVGRGQHSAFIGLASLLLTGTGCRDEAPSTLTQVVVVVDSDIDVPDQLDALKISVTGTVKSAMVEDTLDAEHPLPRSLGVVHSGGPLGPLRVSAIGMRAGEIQVERIANVYFEKDRTLKLALPLMKSCVHADLNCASDETCDRGACVANAVHELPVFQGDDGAFADATAWAAKVIDAGHDSGVDASPSVIAASDSGAADGGNEDAAPHPLVSCHITRPEPGDSFYAGDEITFEGSCTNVDGGEVAARWRSDLDGTIGQRAMFTKNDLSTGQHEISLCVEAAAKPCADALRIQVQELPDISATISSLAQSGKTDGVYSGDTELVAKGAGTGVPPLKFRWLDSFGGELAEGDTAHYAAPMLAGRHSVRLIVTDERGRSAKAERTFEVHAPAHDTLFESYTILNNVLDSGGTTINAITSDGSYHYVGTENGSVLSIAADGPPPSSGTYIGMASKGTGSTVPSVRDVFLRDGVLYLATSRDVQSCPATADKVGTCSVLSLNGLSASSIPRSVRVVTSADTPYLVVGTSLGLWTGTMKALDKGALRENNTVFSGLTESSGNLWIGASAGLYAYALGNTALTANPKKVDNGPSGLTALVSSPSVIWASLSEGIASYDAGSKLWNMWTTNYDTALFGRLVSNDVRTIAITHPVIDGVAHDVIWIGTGSGLSRFDPAIPSFTTYTKADGLPDNAVLRAFGLPSNELLLATQSGLAIHRGQ